MFQPLGMWDIKVFTGITNSCDFVIGDTVTCVIAFSHIVTCATVIGDNVTSVA